MMRKFDADELVIATHNAGKAREIEALLEPFERPKRFYTASDLDLPEPEETGLTFAANAELKALASARGCGKVSLADDSGLSVEALGGDPGIYSARWAMNESGERDFNLAMEKVRLALMDAGEEPSGARAAFICVLSLAWPDGHVESFEGRVEGVLQFPPRGEMGFGYDPVFVPDGYEQSFAEMDADQKHKISHRADAFSKFVAGCFDDL